MVNWRNSLLRLELLELRKLLQKMLYSIVLRNQPGRYVPDPAHFKVIFFSGYLDYVPRFEIHYDWTI